MFVGVKMEQRSILIWKSAMPNKGEKYSKSNTTPEMEAKAAEYRSLMAEKKCMHFALDTHVMRNNVRGKITAMSKDGGSQLWVEWEDGTSGPIRNPNYKWTGK